MTMTAPTRRLRHAGETLVDDRLREFVLTQRERAAAHHIAFEEMWSVLDDLILGGKQLRSALFLTAFQALSDETGDLDEAMIDVACAIELLHVAFLVHDDVIDNDTVRRGALNVAGQAARRTRVVGGRADAAAGFGRAAGVIAGDLLLSAAHTFVAASDLGGSVRRELIALLDDTVFASAAGEHADAWFSLGLEEADPARALRTIELKTARYSFEAPLEAAALLAGSSAETIRSLRDIGRGLGVVYQLRDDVLGVFGAPEITGKSVTADLREGTQTLLVTLARTSPEWQQVAHRFGASDLDDADAAALRDAMRASGALDRVEGAIEAETRIVRRRILHSRLTPGLERHLFDLLDLCAERSS